ncbi:hypothetical protein [Nitrosopumilus maritimus]|uniref:hypothetical protein n=1 Tax=Nitrosopumilus maritimus TaxID=338192 RepID=UPI000AD846D6|nr:hypothetical protein [Nitrosopumilus maritimus]
MQEHCFPRQEENYESDIHNVLAYFPQKLSNLFSNNSKSSLPRHKKSFYIFYAFSAISVVLLTLGL